MLNGMCDVVISKSVFVLVLACRLSDVHVVRIVSRNKTHPTRTAVKRRKRIERAQGFRTQNQMPLIHPVSLLAPSKRREVGALSPLGVSDQPLLLLFRRSWRHHLAQPLD
jgi:hypothetical protein